MDSRAGWYPDPGGSGQQRYFDGTEWTHSYAPFRLPAAGWYPDPQGRADRRYWDGKQWTHMFTATNPGDESVRARAEQQHRWAAEGDIRGIYGEEGAELMRPLIEPTREPLGASAKVAQIAHTGAELTALLIDRPHLWPATAFVSVMTQRREEVIARLRDVQLGFADPNGIDIGEAAKYMLAIKLQSLVKILEQISDLIKTPAFQSMFGESDDEADADVIVLAANRLMDYHDEIIGLAEDSRRMNVPMETYRLQSLVGKSLVSLLQAFDDFRDGIVARLAKLEDALRYGTFRVEDEPVIFSFKTDPELSQELQRQLS